jgi:hypothetical protein
MFELTNKLGRIENYFSETIKKYDFAIKLCNPNRVELINNNCKIEITTQRYYCDLQIVFKNIASDKEYVIGEILNKMNLTGTKILTDAEGGEASLILDELDNGLFSFGIIIKKYFDNILNGDFSIMENRI